MNYKNVVKGVKSISGHQWVFIILGNGVNINLSNVMFEIFSLSWFLFFIPFAVLIWALSYAEPKPASKVKDEDLLAELHNINKSLNKISNCIDSNLKYGSAIKTTQATRY
jgi:hypothetical protein